MRVALATYAFPSDRHGFIADHIYGLVDRGDEVRVVSYSRGDLSRLGEVDPRRLQVSTAPSGDRVPRKLATLTRNLAAASLSNRRQVVDLVRHSARTNGLGAGLVKDLVKTMPVIRHPADVVHIAWLGLATRCTSLMSTVEAPVVVSCHGSDVRIKPMLGQEQRRSVADVFSRADLIHCVSQELADRAISLGAKPDRLFVGHWGVDTDFFRDDPATARERRASAAAGRLRMVSVGRLHWVKGHEYAVESLSRIRRAGIDATLTIIGGHEQNDELLRIATAIRDLRLEGQVVLRGKISREEVRAALRSSDVFVLSSVSEGLNTATIEAMAVGLPVVVTDAGGTREAVTHEIEGLVVPCRDPEALAQALITVAGDLERRERFAANGRARAEREFAITTRVDALRIEYRRLVTG